MLQISINAMGKKPSSFHENKQKQLLLFRNLVKEVNKQYFISGYKTHNIHHENMLTMKINNK